LTSFWEFLSECRSFKSPRRLPRFSTALYSKKAKIEDFWFHDFRHTCITNWRRKGVDFITIMKATGHKTLSMFHRYNAVGDDDLRALVSEKKVDGQNMVNSNN